MAFVVVSWHLRLCRGFCGCAVTLVGHRRYDLLLHHVLNFLFCFLKKREGHSPGNNDCKWFCSPSVLTPPPSVPIP